MSATLVTRARGSSPEPCRAWTRASPGSALSAGTPSKEGRLKALPEVETCIVGQDQQIERSGRTGTAPDFWMDTAA